MADPATKEDFESLYHSNTSVSGYGVDITQHLPCPFCAAKGWATWRLALPVSKVWAEPKKCDACGRTSKLAVTETAFSTSMQLILVDGPDPAPYLAGTYAREEGTAPVIARAELHVPGAKRD